MESVILCDPLRFHSRKGVKPRSPDSNPCLLKCLGVNVAGLWRADKKRGETKQKPAAREGSPLIAQERSPSFLAQHCLNIEMHEVQWLMKKKIGVKNCSHCMTPFSKMLTYTETISAKFYKQRGRKMGMGMGTLEVRGGKKTHFVLYTFMCCLDIFFNLDVCYCFFRISNV